jgi:hypothetical protein
MSLPTFRRVHAYAPGRHPPYSGQTWPIIDLTPDSQIGYPTVAHDGDGRDWLFGIRGGRIVKLQYDDLDPSLRPGDLVQASDPSGPPDYTWAFLATDPAGDYLYHIGWRLGVQHGYQGIRDRTAVWVKRRPDDLAIVGQTDLPGIYTPFDMAPPICQNYPAPGSRLDYLIGAYPSSIDGRFYVLRQYRIWPEMDPDYCYQHGTSLRSLDLVEVQVDPYQVRVISDLPPPAGEDNWPISSHRLYGAAAAQEIWLACPRWIIYGQFWGVNISVWHSGDGGATFDGPHDMPHNLLYALGIVDGHPVGVGAARVFVAGNPDYPLAGFDSGWRMFAWDLLHPADPFYWERLPYVPGGSTPDNCECGVDSDLWNYWVRGWADRPTIGFTYHADDRKRLLISSNDLWVLHHGASPWHFAAPDTDLLGERSAIWLFKAHHAYSDLNLIQDYSDLVHIHVVGDDGLRQYRGPMPDVVAATPDVLGDYGVPGAVRQPDGFLHLLADDGGGAMDQLTSDDDGAAWPLQGAVATLAGTTRPTIHPLAGGGQTQSPGGAGRKSHAYLLTAWKADDLLVYAATDVDLTWSQVGILAEDVPEQKIDLVVLPDGRLRAYYASSTPIIYSRLSEDEGRIWAAPVEALAGCTNPAALILPHGEVLLAAWQGDQLVIARASDGITFGAPLDVRDAGATNLPEHGSPHHCALARSAGGVIYLYCFDTDDLKAACSEDGGRTWVPVT